MIKTTLTYKGKPFDAKEWAKDLKAIVIQRGLEAMQERIVAALRTSLTEDEMSQVVLEVINPETGNPSINVRAPEELNEKVQEALKLYGKV